MKEQQLKEKFESKKKEILGLFNAGQFDALTQNGVEVMTPERIRKDAEYNCRDAKKAVEETADFFLSERQSELSELKAKIEGMRDAVPQVDEDFNDGGDEEYRDRRLAIEGQKRGATLQTFSKVLTLIEELITNKPTQ